MVVETARLGAFIGKGKKVNLLGKYASMILFFHPATGCPGFRAPRSFLCCLHVDAFSFPCGFSRMRRLRCIVPRPFPHAVGIQFSPSMITIMLSFSSSIAVFHGLPSKALLLPQRTLPLEAACSSGAYGCVEGGTTFEGTGGGASPNEPAGRGRSPSL